MKNDSVINLKEALAVFSLRDEKGMFKHFNLTYRTFNSATKKGGKLISYNGVKYLPSAKKETPPFLFRAEAFHIIQSNVLVACLPTPYQA